MPWRGGAWEAVLTLALPFRSRPTSAVSKRTGQLGQGRSLSCRARGQQPMAGSGSGSMRFDEFGE